MCGISGLISKNSFKSNLLKDMNDLIHHRGPDDYGYSFWNIKCNQDSKTIINQNSSKNHIGFGHRRLSILDLTSHGHQPMLFENLSIVFNGEIYNYIEIREELIKLGYTFVTQTDTEVLLKSYSQWGKSCLDKFNGMFSFLIYDENKNEIFGARDRFGVKPLYYYTTQDNNTIMFASEIKQIALSPFYIEKEANKQMVYDYLFFKKSDHTKETMFKNIYQLKGGEYFIINLKNNKYNIDPINWYNLKDKVNVNNNTTFDEYKNIFYDNFKKSINLRLRSDVKVGTCLSGGMDSSAITGMIAKKIKIDTFSIIYPNTIYDEERYAKSVYSKYELNNFSLEPSNKNLLGKIENIIYYQDEPFRSFSQFSQFELFNLVSSNEVKVVLNGQGGDEILGGYPSFVFSAMNENKTSFRKLNKYFKILNKEGSLGKYDKLIYIFELFGLSILDRFKRSSLITKGINNKYFDGINKNKNKNFFSKNFTSHSIDQIKKDFLPQMLHYEDRNSMAFSVESRLPFLDYRIVESTLNVPMEYKINEKQKLILKECMEGIVPEEIINRTDKKGFATPGKEWIDIFSDILFNFDTGNSELFKDIDFKNLISKKENGAKFFLPLFQIAQLMIWSKKFNIKI